MRIAHVITRLLRAGSEENTLTVCAGQSAAGHEVFILHGSSVLPKFARERAPDAKLVGIPSLQRELSLTRDTVAFFQLREALRKISPDIVHTHQSKAGILGRLAAASLRARGTAIIHGVHILPFLGTSGATRAIYLAAERYVSRFTDVYVHVSNGMKCACEVNRVGVGKPHRVVHSGFNIDLFMAAEPAKDRQTLLSLGNPQDVARVIVMLAAIEQRKQHLAFLDHLPSLLSQVPNVVVLLAGEGQLERDVRHRIDQLGLQRNVKCLGYRSDPERVLALADVCVLCSKSEGLPRSALQYLASGQAAVLFYVEGIEDIIKDGENGRLVSNGDWKEFFAGIAQLLKEDGLRQRIANAARRTDLSPWDAALMAPRTIKIYEHALASRALDRQR